MKAIRLLLFPTLLLLWNCHNPEVVQSTSEINPAHQRMYKLDTDICQWDKKAYEIKNSIVLPQVTQIPNHQNKESLIRYLQFSADVYSWNNFIAMNWPAMDGGLPDTTVCFGEKDAVTVWEYWVPESKIFREEGQLPQPWASLSDSMILPHHLKNINLFRFQAKDPGYDTLNAEDAPVVDQDSNFTLYQISYNKVAYDYVVKSKLYNKKGQQEFVQNWPNYTAGLAQITNGDTINIEKQYQRAYFPVGNVKDSVIHNGDNTFSFTTHPVSIITKSAWKQLHPQEDHNKFHVRQTTNEKGETVHLGLVGLHFIQKVAESTQWVWSTFEHVDNAPEMDKEGNLILEQGKDYIYFNEADTNKRFWNISNPINYHTNQFERYPTQVVREVDLEYSTESINKRYHAILKSVNPNSVWLNYELIGTQWPFDPELFTLGDEYQPGILANSVMETYKQKSSTCMGCHKNARFTPHEDSTSYFSDFVFSLERAK